MKFAPTHLRLACSQRGSNSSDSGQTVPGPTAPPRFPLRFGVSPLLTTARAHLPLLGSNYVTALLKPTFLKRDAPSRCGSQASRPSPEVSGRWKR